MSPLEELLAAEDDLKAKVLANNTGQGTSVSIQTDGESQMYKEMPPTVTSDDPAAW